MDYTVDTLQLEIESSATEADKSLDALLSSLRKLDRLGKSEGLLKVRDNLRKLSNVKLDRLESQLANIAGYIKELNTVQRALKAFGITTPRIDTQDTRDSVHDLVDEVNRGAEEVHNVGENFGNSETANAWYDPIRQECSEMLDGFTKSADAIIESRERLRALLDSKADKFSGDSKFQAASSFEYSMNDQLLRANNLAENLRAKYADLTASGKPPNAEEWRNFENQILALKGRYDSLIGQAQKYNAVIDDLGKKAAGTKGFLGKMFDKFKNVAVYRIVRRLLAQIGQAASEGLKNIASYSEAANKVLSQYKTEGLYLKNSFGSALLPILDALAPTIIRIGDALADILNSVGMLTAALNGDKTFLKAKKYAQDYTEALEQVNKATMGIDELNILSDSSQQSDYSQMFEEVDISGSNIMEAVKNLALFAGSLAAILALFKGKQIINFFKQMAAGFKNAGNFLGNMSAWKKGISTLALMAVQAINCYDAFYDMQKGSISLGQGLLQIIPITVAVGWAMNSMLGPVGLVITAVVTLIAGIAGMVSAQEDLKHENYMVEFFKMSGVEISTVNDLLDKYFKSINIDKQAEWNEKLAEATDNLMDAARNYDQLWKSISGCDKIDETQINDLADAFNELADAAIALNDAAIQSVMASIRTGIELNITPELTARLDNLLASLQTAQDLLNVKVAGLTAEYQQLLNEISANGGNITDDQRKRLEALRSDINNFTLTDKTSSYEWKMSIDEAIEKGINAGTNEEEIKNTLNELVGHRDEYLATLKTNQATSLSTLSQLWEKDRTMFGGALGIYKGEDLFENSEAYKTLMENYQAQVAAVQEEYRKVLQSIINSFSEKAIKESDLAGYSGDFWKDFWYGFKKGITFGIYESGEKKAYDEQQEFLKWLQSLLNVDGYATGGMPESGEFFKAREDGIPELVGTIGHHTAVANNTQIIEGIKEGVLEAMQQAQGDDDGEKTIHLTVNLDGKQVADVVEKYNKRKAVGKTIYSGGVLNGV